MTDDRTPFDLLVRDCRLPDGTAADVGCRDGRIAAIGSLGERRAARTVAAAGGAVTPGLVEAHIHLDKALLSRRTPSVEGTLAEAIRLTSEAKRRFTADDIRARARAVLDMAVRAGTTAMRSHVEVDPVVGLTGVEAILPLKAEYAPALDLQICAFAQEGVLNLPGEEALLREALRLGADLVGGCPYTDTDPIGQVQVIFRLAREFGVDADFHTDFFDEPDHLHVHAILEQTRAAGWQGRVAVGHLTELAALPPAEQDKLAAALAEAGVAVIVLPATDLYLMGRKDERNVRRGLAPVRRLLRAGVTVAASTNNVRNAFTPVGNASLPLMGYLLAVGAHMGTPADLHDAWRALTEHPARILRLADYGLARGARADLVLWDTPHADEIITAQAAPRMVIKRGRVTVEHERTIREPWRAKA
jgi:cytosine deaminase